MPFFSKPISFTLCSAIITLSLFAEDKKNADPGKIIGPIQQVPAQVPQPKKERALKLLSQLEQQQQQIQTLQDNVESLQNKDDTEMQMHIRNLQNQLSELQNEVDELEKNTAAKAPRYPSGGDKRGFTGLFVTGEYLYWKVQEGGLEFANVFGAEVGDLADADTRKIGYTWKSGFRVGGGYMFPCCDWDLTASYTWFQPEASESVQGNLFPLLDYQGRFPLFMAASATARHDLHFQALDVDAGREVKLCRAFSLRPHFGVKAAWIDQEFNVSYSGGAPMIPPGQSFTIHASNDFNGVGISAGMDTIWNVVWAEGISLFADFKAALLVGSFNVHQIQNQRLLDQINLSSHFHRLSPEVELQAGIGWDWNFGKKFHVGLEAAFEAQYWWGQNQMERFTSALMPIYVRANEGLGLYGFTFGLRLDF